MNDVSCKLISTSIQKNSIGVEIEINVETSCPIIKVEDVYSKEYYEANQQGYKPSLRLRISSLNYNNESELIYMDNVYSIIRTEGASDEIILVCERKVKNVKSN